jgi:hypothetical protein
VWNKITSPEEILVFSRYLPTITTTRFEASGAILIPENTEAKGFLGAH